MHGWVVLGGLLPGSASAQSTGVKPAGPSVPPFGVAQTDT
jgi:hypothetical protein